MSVVQLHCKPLSVPDAAGFVPAWGFQSVWLGMGAGMGAAVARPDRLAVVVIGGGLLMSLGEIDAAIHLGVPMIIMVIALSGYSKAAARGAAFGRAAEARLLRHKVTQTPQIHAFAIPETYCRGTCLVLDIHHDSGHHDSSQSNIGGRSRNREWEARMEEQPILVISPEAKSSREDANGCSRFIRDGLMRHILPTKTTKLSNGALTPLI